ncbi:peptidase S8/S53 domain-containing protein [Sporodiniella umbellata]|nr:peptidase S8/S53 domain-containing protein [Sporodiniella umbellata]
MVKRVGLLTLVSLFGLMSSSQGYVNGKRELQREYYTIHVPQGEWKVAEHVAHQLQVRLEGKVGELDSYFMISVPKENLENRDGLDRVLNGFEHYKSLSSHKRDDSNWSKVTAIEKQIPKRRVKRGPIPVNAAHEVYLDIRESLDLKDPLFDKQWHLINQKNPGNDLNVTGLWKEGVTGQGVKVVILDDGLDYNSTDLADNFFAEGSYDFNDHESLPTPKLWDDNHGTRCAGQIAAVKNDVCGVGIAYEAKVAGVRILSGDLTDADEAIALNYKYQENDIFSCSWGPTDDGRTMEAPKGILAEAFINGVNKGRGGKGSIYVFATGNGGTYGDNCNFDGYTNSIYTISVGAIDHTNGHPPYSEACSAQLIVAYSSGGGEYIQTTDVNESCSSHHGGTSAAAPNAAGIFALVLSVRPDLTWRDLQHLCVQTAVPINTSDNDWKKLPSGRIFNHKFGYGKLDAYALVEAAKSHKIVNKQTWLEFPNPVKKRNIPDSSGQRSRKALKSTVKVTEGMIKAAGLLRLEHVTATVNIDHDRRGDLVINLESPSSVKSELATQRTLDKSKDGIRDWKFMSVKHWEENPIGDWILSVYDVGNPDSTGQLLNWTLTLFGEQDPDFKGKPIHTTLGFHEEEDTEHEITQTSSLPEPTPSDSDKTPSRPTRIKPDKKPSATPSTDSSEEKTSEELETSNNADGYLTVIYAVFGSLAVFAVAASLYLYRRKNWFSASSADRQGARPDGHEFDVLQPLTQIEEEEEEESEDGRLVRNNH